MSVATGLPLHREGLIAPASEEDTSERTTAGENFVKSVENPPTSEVNFRCLFCSIRYWCILF